MVSAVSSVDKQENKAGAGCVSADTAKLSWILGGLLVVALLLRLYQIGTHGLFIEELYSVFVASGKADPPLAHFDNIRPLYFILLRVCMQFGTSEVWLRLISVVFGVANVALTYKLASMLVDRRAGLFAALLTALSPMEICFSQQVRMYTLGSSLMLCGSIAFVRALATNNKKLVCTWAIMRLMMMLTLPLTATLLAADAAILWWHRRETKLMPFWIGGAIASTLLWLPFGCQLAGLRSNPYSTWTRSVPSPLISDPLTLLINFTCTSLSIHDCKGPPVKDWYSAAYVLLVPILLGVAVFASRKFPKIIWCASWLFVPVAIFEVWSNVGTPVLEPRYLLFITPPLFILLGAGFSGLLNRFRPAAYVALALYGLTVTACLSFYYHHPMYEDWRDIAAFISANEKPGDQIGIWQYHSADLLKYYYRGPNEVHDMVVMPTRRDGSPYDVNVTVQGVPTLPSRTWFISRIPPKGWPAQYDLYEHYKAALTSQFHILRHESLAEADVYLVSPMASVAR